MSNHFDEDLILIQKFDPEKPFAVVHYEGKAKNYYVKRFVFENIAVGKKLSLISEEAGSKLIYLSGNPEASLTVDVLKGKSQTPETLEIKLAEFIDLKGIRANGNSLSPHDVKNIAINFAEEPELTADMAIKEDALKTDAEAEGAAAENDDIDALSDDSEVSVNAEVINDADEMEAVSTVINEPETDSPDESEAETPEIETPEIETPEIDIPEIEAPETKEQESPKPEIEDTQIQPEPAKETQNTAPAAKVKPKFFSEPIKAPESAEAPAKAVAAEKLEKNADKADQPAKPVKQKAKFKTETPPAKKAVKLEITNPDDVDLDNNGQLDLF